MTSINDHNILVWAIKTGDLDVVKSFINQGVNVNTEVSGRSLLHYASDSGQKEVVEYLVHNKADVNAIDNRGISVLLAAIYESHASCVQYLISKGASLKGKTPTGETYISVATDELIKNMLIAAEKSLPV